MSRSPRLRSLLFAPGNRPDVAAKTPRSGPDGVVLDLEDAVPAAEKERARATARDAARDLVATHPALAVYVRVNAVTTAWFAGDVADGLHPTIAGVVVPKLESAADVDTVAAALHDHGLGHLLVVAGIETARGVARAEEVLAGPVATCYFGAEDFTADMGGTRTEGSLEVLYARSRVALAARIADVDALDQVVVDLRDEERFVTDARAGRALGYRGKICIHPAQVPLANRVFAPSEAEIEHARRIVTAYEDAAARGTAAFELDGELVDEPMVRRARATLDAAAS